MAVFSSNHTLETVEMKRKKKKKKASNTYIVEVEKLVNTEAYNNSLLNRHTVGQHIHFLINSVEFIFS